MRVAPTRKLPMTSKQVRLVLLGLIFASSSLVDCERKAPGPTECAWFAEAFIGMARDDERATFREQAAIDEVTQLCLTTPYDRELIACSQSTKRARACFDAYKVRTRRAL
jgi:hypothetical protein